MGIGSSGFKVLNIIIRLMNLELSFDITFLNFIYLLNCTIIQQR